MTFKRVFLFFLLNLPALLFSTGHAEEIYPGDRTFMIEKSIDLNALPEELIFIEKEKLSEMPWHLRWSWLTLLCYSDTDASRGACPVRSISGAPSGDTKIVVTFTEKRSRLTQTLNLAAYGQAFWNSNGSCSPNYFDPRHYEINNTHSYPCRDSYAQSKAITVYISADELKKIPVGGAWEGVFSSRIYSHYDKDFYGRWDINMQLNVVDSNNITVYLPQFPSATPRVDLKLHTIPTPATPGGGMRGQANLDMCLYDGFNANSNRYQVTLTDDQTVSDRADGTFSVFRDSQPSAEARKRVDYRASLRYNGRDIALPNNEAITLEGVNQAEVRPVLLPNIPQPVYCTPAPLSLTTPVFNQIGKESGNYGGRLRVIFTPSLQ